MTQPPHDPFLPPQQGQVPPAAPGQWPDAPYNAWQQPGQPVYGYAGAPVRATNGLAIAALVTAFNVTPVSIGLAVGALVQLRERDQAGKGLAIAALVVSSLLSVVIAAITIAGLSGAFDYPMGPVGPVVDAGSDQVGTCLRISGDSTDRPVPCTSSHDEEVYFVAKLPGAAFPGADRIEDLAAGTCLTAFRPYVGVRKDDSGYSYAWYSPSSSEWAGGEHRVVCVITEGDAYTLEGSVRDSGL